MIAGVLALVLLASAVTGAGAPSPPPALDELPEARYDAVLPQLDAPEPKRFGRGPALIFTLQADLALYSSERTRPVARLAARNFLAEPTVILGYPPRPDGWQLVLTPARRQLPSRGAGATAQSYAWVRADELPAATRARAVIEISVAQQTLTVRDAHGAQTYPAGVGGPRTPTPRRVTGYLQARYLDPAQGQSVQPIQLTSLHATAADEPYGGDDGGLIGLHLGSGSSHGCVRLGAAAVEALDALPLGTPVVIE